MTELFRDNDECQFFYQIYKQAKYFNAARYVNQMTAESIGSRALGQILYSSTPAFADNGIDEDFFINNYLQIIEAYRSAGTLDAYYYLIKSALGADSVISFENPSAGYLKINVTAETYPYGLAVQDDNGIEQGVEVQDNETSPPNGLIVNSTISAKTVEQLQYVLNFIVPAGLYVEFNLTQDSLYAI